MNAAGQGSKNGGEATGPAAALGEAFTNVTNAVKNGATNAVNAVKNGANNAAKAVNKAVNGPGNNGASTFSSLMPFGNNAGANNSKKNENAGGFFGNNAGRNNNGAAANNSGGAAAGPLAIFAGLVVFFLIIFAVFNKQIREGYEYVAAAIQNALGIPTNPDVQASVTPSQGETKDVTMPPEPPQGPQPLVKSQESIVEKLLPISADGKEVFNVSSNKFTYYDAEPLCKALGAELATYDQVKEAWDRGADWCNYGWVKGQMAVYPTQKDTYEKLQGGPEDQRNACGTVGINGGSFDNPELRYGVTCYGKKPSQSAHDEALLMQQGKVPQTPDSLEFDKKVNQYKTLSPSLFVRPFNDGKWSEN
jgi:hypothetical protein